MRRLTASLLVLTCALAFGLGSAGPTWVQTAWVQTAWVQTAWAQTAEIILPARSPGEVVGHWRGTAGVYTVTERAVFLNGGAEPGARRPILLLERARLRSGGQALLARTLTGADKTPKAYVLGRDGEELVFSAPDGEFRVARIETPLNARCFDTRPNPEALFGFWRLASGAAVRFGEDMVEIEGATQRVLRYRVEKRSLAVFEIAPEDADKGLTRGQAQPVYAGVPLGMDAALLYLPTEAGDLEETPLARPVSTCFDGVR